MNKNDSKIIWITCLLSTISFFLIDCYLPSFPHIMNFFGSKQSSTQLLVSFYLIGLGCSQFFYGILSDKFGRKNILLLGISIAFITNLISVFASSLSLMVILRTLTGLGAGACPVVARAILSDQFEGHTLLKSNSYLSMSITMSPAIAPVVGGIIQELFGWKGNFLLISFWCFFAILLLIFMFKETHLPERREEINFFSIKNNFIALFLSKDFISSSIISCFSISAGLSYYISTPFIFQNKLHLSPVFNGAIYVLTAFSNLAGAYFVNYKSKSTSPEILLELGTKIAFWGSIFMLIFSIFEINNIFSIVIPMLLVSFAFGLIMPSTGTIAIRKFKTTGGTCAAALGLVRMGGSAIITSIVAIISINTQLGLSFVLISLFLSCRLMLKSFSINFGEVFVKN